MTFDASSCFCLSILQSFVCFTVSKRTDLEDLNSCLKRAEKKLVKFALYSFFQFYRHYSQLLHTYLALFLKLSWSMFLWLALFRLDNTQETFSSKFLNIILHLSLTSSDTFLCILIAHFNTIMIFDLFFHGILHPWKEHILWVVIAPLMPILNIGVLY